MDPNCSKCSSKENALEMFKHSIITLLVQSVKDHPLSLNWTKASQARAKSSGVIFMVVQILSGFKTFLQLQLRPGFNGFSGGWKVHRGRNPKRPGEIDWRISIPAMNFDPDHVGRNRRTKRRYLQKHSSMPTSIKISVMVPIANGRPLFWGQFRNLV